MAKAKSVTKPAVDLSILDTPPEGKILLVKNLYRGGISIHSDALRDGGIIIFRLGEATLPAAERKNANLVSFLRKGLVSVEWVDESYEARRIPDPQDAPPELQTDNRNEAAFAMDIVLGDDPEAIGLINTTVYQGESTEINVPYMRNTFAKVLKLADYLETQVRDRSKIHATIKTALRRIQDL